MNAASRYPRTINFQTVQRAERLGFQWWTDPSNQRPVLRGPGGLTLAVRVVPGLRLCVQPHYSGKLPGLN